MEHNSLVHRDQFPTLNGDVYADWTGAALPPRFFLDECHKILTSNILGNPHSHHKPSARAMDKILEAREAILKYFNAPNNEYEVIFTSGASSAIQLMQHFKFMGGELLLTADNHNSVNGIREMAKQAGGVVRYSGLSPDLMLDASELDQRLTYPRSTGNKLFIMPAKSNYTGHYHDFFKWVPFAQARGWHVMLDAAAYLSNSNLNLSMVQPDFVPVSFYKLFGYPTGLGCLLIRKSAFEVMHKKFFAGGSILLVSVMKDFFAPEVLGYARYEDGTVNFANIPMITQGLRFLSLISNRYEHVVHIQAILKEQIGVINSHYGQRIIIHTQGYSDTLTFSIVDEKEEVIDAWHFEEFASREGLYIRTGCFCNPGVNEKIFNYSIDSFDNLYNDKILPEQMTIEHLRNFSNGKPIGAIRASFGYANSNEDAANMAQILSWFVSQTQRGWLEK